MNSLSKLFFSHQIESVCYETIFIFYPPKKEKVGASMDQVHEFGALDCRGH